MGKTASNGELSSRVRLVKQVTQHRLDLWWPDGSDNLKQQSSDLGGYSARAVSSGDPGWRGTIAGKVGVFSVDGVTPLAGLEHVVSPDESTDGVGRTVEEADPDSGQHGGADETAFRDAGSVLHRSSRAFCGRKNRALRLLVLDFLPWVGDF